MSEKIEENTCGSTENSFSCPTTIDEEQRLKEAMYDAMYEYYAHIRVIWSEKFKKETEGMVLDDTLASYKLMTNIDEESCFSEMFEPDTVKSYKTWVERHINSSEDDMNAKTLMKKYYDNHDYWMIAHMILYWDENNKTLVGYDPTVGHKPLTKSKQIFKWKSQMWYLWFNNNKYFSKFMIKPEELAKKKEKIRLEQEERDLLEKHRDNWLASERYIITDTNIPRHILYGSRRGWW